MPNARAAPTGARLEGSAPGWNRATLRDDGGNAGKKRIALEKMTVFAGFEASKTAPRATPIRIFPRKTAASA